MSHLTPQKRGFTIKAAGSIILMLFIILTFVSKSIYTHSLPNVTAVTPAIGKLDKSETVKGVAEWAEKIEVYTDRAGYVEALYVKSGDKVLKGQPLAKLVPTEDEIAAEREQAYALEQIDAEIKVAQANSSDLLTLYEGGAIPRVDYEKSVKALQDLNAKKQKCLLDRQAASNAGSLMIYATEDSVVLELKLHKGQRVNKGELAVLCGGAGHFNISTRIAADNNFIAEGDACSLENTALALEGVVTEVKVDGENKAVTVQIQSMDVKAGDTFDVRFEKKSMKDHTLIPSGALQKDREGYFIYQVKQREGILGEEFFVQKQRITIGDNDNENTILLKGITFFEPMVLLSDKTLTDGDTVLLENEGDFFAK